jgi:hypothetical protein
MQLQGNFGDLATSKHQTICAPQLVLDPTLGKEASFRHQTD